MRRTANAPLVPATWNVPEVFRDRLGASVGRQRLMEADGHLLLVTHKPPEPDQDDRAARLFWRAPDGSWSCSDLGGGAGTLAKHLSQFAERLDALEETEHSASRAEEYFSILESLAPLHRALRNAYSVLQEARQAMPDDRELINVRDLAYELDRRAELLHSVTKNGLDYAVARRAEEQAAAANNMAAAAHRLNILAAFFFPLATLSSIFGMTLLDEWKSGAPPMSFLIVIGVGVAMGFGLHSWVIQKK